MENAHHSFLRTFLLLLGGTLLCVLSLNFVLVYQSLHGRHNTVMASQWQKQTHGVVSAPSATLNGYLKQLRLQDQLLVANTFILGASTTFAVEQSMFPEPMRIFNFSKNGVGLSTMIGEAEYLLEHAPQAKWLVIPLDWSIGFLYETGTPPQLDLAVLPEAAEAEQDVSWLLMARDALSYPRVEGLARLIQQILASEHPVSAFRQVFMQASSDPYPCPDGTPARDFDIQSRGHCQGFRHDGSWTYLDIDRVSNANRLIMLATASNSKYTHNLQLSEGQPNSEFLARLAALAQRADQRGGGILFLMPPLLSGMEAEFLRHPQWAPLLARTKETLRLWAAQHHLVLIDAGSAETFGCTTQEFTDEHHADQSCYRKIFASFWQNHQPQHLQSIKH